MFSQQYQSMNPNNYINSIENTTCRLCLKKYDPNELEDLFNCFVNSTTTAQYITNFAKIPINREDCFSKVVCKRCLKNLNEIEYFRKYIYASHQCLEQLYIAYKRVLDQSVTETIPNLNIQSTASPLPPAETIENGRKETGIEEITIKLEKDEDFQSLNQLLQVETKVDVGEHIFIEAKPKIESDSELDDDDNDDIGNEYEEIVVTNNKRKDGSDLTFPCDNCDKIFKYKRGRDAHLKSHTKRKCRKCEVCGKRFSTEFVFLRHERMHKESVRTEPMESVEQFIESEDSSASSPDLLKVKQTARLDLFPKKSKEKYEKEYEKFKVWCYQRQFNQTSEQVLVDYFSDNSQMKSSSLWAKYSMLRCTIAIKENVDIKYPKLIAFLKGKSIGYRPKKSFIFTKDNINRFLLEAPDEIFLMIKVCLVIGVAGACRGGELTEMSIDDIEEQKSFLLCTIPYTKGRKHRTFVINNFSNCERYDVVALFRKYTDLRPLKIQHRRLFLNYRTGKCSVQPVGKNTMNKIPSLIAQFLQLPNPVNYTGHCFRRTAGSLLADTGEVLESLKRYDKSQLGGGDEEYFNNSDEDKSSLSETEDCMNTKLFSPAFVGIASTSENNEH